MTSSRPAGSRRFPYNAAMPAPVQSVAATAMVVVQSRAAEQALTARMLGAERAGHGVRIRADGLIATVGYLVLEAEQVWVVSHNGQGAAAHVVAHDHDSGIALLRPELPLDGAFAPPGSTKELAVGETMSICRSGYKKRFSCKLFAKREFAGRWEYLLDEALFTSPGCHDWAGAALLNQSGQVCGVGSLLMEMPHESKVELMGNMFIPMELVAPFLDEMCEHGRRRGPARPWLGMLTQEYEGKLVVVDVYPDCPAARAGVKPGDAVLSVDDEPVNSLPEMFRKVWSLGGPGVEVPLLLSDAGALRQCRIESADRAACYRSGAVGAIN